MASTPTDPEVVPGSAILIIDPQVDFHPGGALPVAGADEDANRIGSFIRNNLDGLEAVHITLDSHQRNHISHSLFWVNAEGKAPPPFTPISHNDVVMKKWVAALPENQAYVEQYTRTLKENGRFQHCIWPEHCLIGSPGHCVVPPILEACHAWVEHSRRPLTFTHKGMNVLTEMYSCFKADVPVASDPSTGMNVKLVESLLRHPKVYICGQALSHCVAFSVRDLVSAWPPERLGDLVLLCHMSSPVGGFEAQAQAFVQFAKDQGLTVIGA